jgi:hypothetical protein
VENLLMIRAFPVDGATAEFFSARALRETRGKGHVDRLSRLVSLDRRTNVRTIHSRSSQQFFNFRFLSSTYVAADLHRFQQSIRGHSYLIEVAPVERDRWRACIVRARGMPTALMPFYGRTPDEAARQLSDWLARAHEHAGDPAETV